MTKENQLFCKWRELIYSPNFYCKTLWNRLSSCCKWNCHMLKRVSYERKTPVLYKEQWASCLRMSLYIHCTLILISSRWITLILQEPSLPEVPHVRRENSHSEVKFLLVFILFFAVCWRSLYIYSTMTSTLRRVYHITAFSWYAFIVKSLAAKDGEELPPGIFVYGGPWKYLTFLNLVSQFRILC